MLYFSSILKMFLGELRLTQLPSLNKISRRTAVVVLLSGGWGLFRRNFPGEIESQKRATSRIANLKF